MLRVLADENIANLDDYLLCHQVELIKMAGRAIDRQSLITHQPDALFIRSVTQVTQENLGDLSNTPLKFIGSATIGIDHIDIQYLADHHINFANASGCSKHSVAQYVITAILHAHQSPKTNLRLGIIGLGNTGNTLARYAKRLGWQVFGFDPFLALFPLAFQPDVKNIIFIMGESLSAKHVNYFGYERETMPFISKLANENPNNTVLKEAYSAGLMTAISLPALFNAIPHPNGLKQIMKGDTNFFKLAKIQGFNTYFYTAQPERTMMIMSIMGKSWMDHQITPTQLGLSPDQGINDHKLLPLLQKIDLDKEKNFIVLHQRGSHGPYAEYLSEEEKIFKDGSPLDNYDSTIYNTDQLIEKVYNYLETRGKDDYVLIYTSDHGQFVTKNHYNQGTTTEDQYLVPAFIYTKNDKINQKLKQLDQCKRLFHQQLSTLVINIMGFDMPISSCEKGVINSGMITGDYGYLSVEQAKPPAFINPNRK